MRVFPAPLRRLFPELLLAVGLACFFLWCTPHGLLLSSDSINYYQSAARHFARGDGFLIDDYATGLPVPGVVFPPLYPLLLAIPIVGGISPLAGAHLLGLLLYVANALLLTAGARATGCSRPLAVAVALLAMLHPHLVQIHIQMMSEPLFLTLLLLLLLRLHYWRRGVAVILQAGVLGGLLLLCRYSALLPVVALFPTTLWVARNDRRQIRQVLLFFPVLAFFPFLLLQARNLAVAGSGTARSLVLNPFPVAKLYAGLGVVSQWFIPGEVPVPARALLLGVLVAVIATALWRRTRRGLRPPVLAAIACGWAVCTALQILFAAWFIYPADGFEYRHMVSAYCGVLLALTPLLRDLAAYRYGPLCIAALVILQLLRATILVTAVHRDGLGLSGPAWRSTGAWQLIRLLPPETQLVSNAPDAVYFYTGRPTNFVPFTRTQPYAPTLLRPGTVLVWFNGLTWRRQTPVILPATVAARAELLYTDGLVRVARLTP